MKSGKEGKFKKEIDRVVHDYAHRTFLSSSLSMAATAVFGSYNLYLGFSYHAAWNFGIAVYFLLLCALRGYVLFSERALYKRCPSEEEREEKKKKLYLVQSFFLFIIDLALIAPVSLMVMQRREIGYTAIPAIATAAYTTYKVILSTMNFIKNKRQSDLSVRILKNVSFVDALVSVLTLQYILVMTFGDGIGGGMLFLCATTTFILWGAIVAVSVFALVSAVRLRGKSPADSGKR